MRHVEELTEHEMVATFLKAEVASTRFRKDILELLRRDRTDRSIIDQPDTRLPGEAAKNVRAGQKIFGRSTRWHLDFACALEGGAQFPELILVGTGPDSQLVLLEGHGRLTAYSLVPTRTPTELSVIIGFSRNMRQWVFF